MAVVTFSKKIFEKDVGKLDEKMQNRISMFGTPLEGINGEDVQIEVSPNRPDMLSYHGFKRAFLAFLGKKTGLVKYKTNPPEKDYSVIVDSSVKDVRPFTACAIVRGLQLDDDRIKEIIDLQEKLHSTLGRKRKKIAIGIYPLEKIKLPITFKALEPDRIKFVPLESEKEMSGLEILQKHPAGRDYAHLLAGKEKFPVFMDSDGKILSMPPVINSHNTGKVTEKTKDVFVECSGFDFEILKKTLNIIASILAEMGGKIYQMEIKYSKKETTPDFSEEEMNISLENANRLLGLDLNEKQLKECLEKMGHECAKGRAKIPSWRTDVLHEVDLIEDVAIAYGYENLAPEIPKISTIGEESEKEVIKRKIAEILAGLGMLENLNYHLTSREFQFSNMGLQEKDLVELEESKTDYNILRKDLAHLLLKVLSENSDSEYPQKIFEMGRVFEKKGGIVERENLAGAISPGNFTDLKRIIEYLFRMLELEIKIEEPKDFLQYFIEGRVGRIILASKGNDDRSRFEKMTEGIGLGGKKEPKTLGYIGEIHPRILRNWKIKMPVALFEINLDEMLNAK